MNGVNLNAVNACIHKLFGGLCECIDLIVNLFNGHGTGFYLVVPAVRSSRSRCGDIVKVCYGACKLTEQGVLKKGYHGLCDSHGASHAGCELDKELGAGFVELLHVNGKILEHLVILVQPAAKDRILDALHAGQDKADAVLSAVKQEISRLLIKMAGLHPAEQGCTAHRALDDAVGNLDIADLPGGKQGFILRVHCVSFLFHMFFTR